MLFNRICVIGGVVTVLFWHDAALSSVNSSSAAMEGRYPLSYKEVGLQQPPVEPPISSLNLQFFEKTLSATFEPH